MPARIDTGPFDRAESLKALLQSEPEAIEAGFRVLELDLLTAGAGRIEILGVDADGSLTLIAFTGGQPDVALARLLDGYRWASTQYRLVCRAYSLQAAERSAGRSPEPSIRLLLIGPRFSHGFLNRLRLLNVRVVPLLARRIKLRDETHLLVESAATLYGTEPDGSRSEPDGSQSEPDNRRSEPAGIGAESAVYEAGPNGDSPVETPMEEAERLAFETLGRLPPRYGSATARATSGRSICLR